MICSISDFCLTPAVFVAVLSQNALEEYILMAVTNPDGWFYSFSWSRKGQGVVGIINVADTPPRTVSSCLQSTYPWNRRRRRRPLQYPCPQGLFLLMFYYRVVIRILGLLSFGNEQRFSLSSFEKSS